MNLCWKGLLWGPAWPFVCGYKDKVSVLTWGVFGLGPELLTFIPWFGHVKSFVALAELDSLFVALYMLFAGNKYVVKI